MSTDVLDRPAGAATAARKKKRRRRRFSLNGLAIQLSAFALSFTLVALLVVSGSQAAFVEESEAVTNYVPIGTTAPPAGQGPRRPPGSPAVPSSPAATSPAATSPAATTRPEPAPAATVVELTDSDAGTAMFTDGVPLAPGEPEERCIEVTYRGDVDPRPVLLYATATSGDLAPYLDLAVDIGQAAPGSFGSCAGFVPERAVYVGTLADFAAVHGSYAVGAPTWEPADDRTTRTFRFTVAVQDDPAAAGLSATFGFSWATGETA